MDWNDFATRLTLELNRLPVRSFLIVQGTGGLPYAQAMRSESALDAEAVASVFLPRPLSSRQERRLVALGWEPPDDEDRQNWWHHFSVRERGTRAAAEQLEECAMLAGRMVGAFRDVYRVGSPLELVYQASRSGEDGGPLALPGLGIPLALPEEEDEPASPADLEAILASAQERGDQDTYLSLIGNAVLFLPAPGDATATDHQYATARFGDGTFVLAFTSIEAMARSLRGQAVDHRPASLAGLARDWPDPGWQLAINPGLPSAAYLDTSVLGLPAAEAGGAQQVPREQNGRAAAQTAATAARPESNGRPGQASAQNGMPRAAQAAPRAPSQAAQPSRPPAPGPPVRDVQPQERSDPAAAHAAGAGTPVQPLPGQGAHPPAQGVSASDPVSPMQEPGRPRSGSQAGQHGGSSRAHAPGPPRQPAGPTPEQPITRRGTPKTGVPRSPAGGDVAPGHTSGRPSPGGSHSPEQNSQHAEGTSADGGTLFGREYAAHKPGPAPGASAPRAGGAHGSGAPTALIIMQKVVRPEHVPHYLDGGYDLVAGYVHRLQDVREMNSPARLVRGLGLIYQNSPFSTGDESIHVIRWPALKPPLFRKPLGGIDEWSMGIIPGGWVIEKAPFPGSGYAPGDGPPVPEFKIDSQRLPHGTEMYRLNRSRDETQIASYDADLRRWLGFTAPGGRA